MNHLDLFSGIGGFSLGMERAGFNTVAMCEIEEDQRKVLKKHWKDIPIYCDVREITDEKLRADGITGIDVITGGFPCTDISIGGKGEGIHGEKSSLWFAYLKVIASVRPRYAIVENVSALLGRGLSTVLGGLAEVGYDACWTMFDSKYFGKPQRRRRVYILAVRDGIPDGSDPFKFAGRSSAECSAKVGSVDRSRKWNFEKGEGEQHPFAYFTRQRSDEYAETGLSSTLTKRDYKSYTDLVLQNGIPRRVTPTERLLIQGFPPDWFDDLKLSYAQKFRLNGMSVGVVAHIGELLKEYHAHNV